MSLSVKKRMRIRTSEVGGVRRHKVEADVGSLFGYGGLPGSFGGNLSVFAPGEVNQMEGIIEPIVPEHPTYLARIYKDMYLYDTIAGSAVDMISTLPFSDFSLVGANDKELAVFEDCINRLQLKTIFPELSVDYMVNGAFVSTLIYKEETKSFTDSIPHDLGNIEVVPSPIYGVPPVLKLRVPKDMQDFLTSKEEHFVNVRKRLSDELIKTFSNSVVSLNPKTTLYIPRKTFSTSIGTSLYRRLLPLYMLEKILYRGTYSEASRRQRSILHVMAGDEDWEPTSEELLMIVQQFQEADLDPVGAIVATRNGVQTAEIRAGGDFWKYTEVTDATTPMKLRGLGVSEAFLSGDASYNNMETSLSVFIENIRAYRDMLTRRVFTNYLFPTLSVLHGFYTDDYRKGGGSSKRRLDSYERKQLVKSANEGTLDHRMKNVNKYLIPQVQWHKSLRPQADREYMDILSTLVEKGVPIPIATWAAAGGMNIDTLLEEAAGEKAMRKQIQDLGFPLPEGMGGDPNMGMGDQGGDGGEGGGDANYETESDVSNPDRAIDPQERTRRLLRRLNGPVQKSRRISDVLFNPALRDNPMLNEIREKTRTGKERYVVNQASARRKKLAQIGKAMDTLRDESALRRSARDGRAAGVIAPFRNTEF